jgi:uncharacterized protein (DUF1810 family)
LNSDSDPFDLDRFVQAQEGIYDQALEELRDGRKESHWMWFIFPQAAGLGRSLTAQAFAIRSPDEGRAYLAHPILGARLSQCTVAILAHEDRSAEQIFGPVDAMKLRSSVTLFGTLAGPDSPYAACLRAFFDDRADPLTIRFLASS